MSSKGYAAALDGQIQINTVHSHARGAMVNVLFLNGVIVNVGDTDEQIRQAFIALQHLLEDRLTLVEVYLDVRYIRNPETVDLLEELT